MENLRANHITQSCLDGFTSQKEALGKGGIQVFINSSATLGCSAQVAVTVVPDFSDLNHVATCLLLFACCDVSHGEQ